MVAGWDMRASGTGRESGRNAGREAAEWCKKG